ncbi:MAG: S-methyl-5-thioribose-1-phosphate isomerase [Planctomycetes bacterium]|nr:S-methyl-5-thioribose-1-phosphate isomerase [Planctomycetota bacterium]
MNLETISWSGTLAGHARLLDQTLLPLQHVVLEIRDVDAMRDAIRRLAVRGAPAIGVAAAFGVLLALRGLDDHTPTNVVGVVREAAATLAKARPTAVNLFWALDRMVARAEAARAEGQSGEAIGETLFAEAQAIAREDAQACERMGAYGAELIADGATLLTHCNAGALATAGIGTALAPIYCAARAGKRVHVFADETRPLLQGARLTAWELARNGIDVTLITDNMAGKVMQEGRIDAVFVGADRIARNGDVCNKIGTYSVATLARAHSIPFYVVAPLSTFDPSVREGAGIPIEERAADEVTQGFGRRTAPEGVRVYNPAFDVTPARLVSAIITEAGIVREPDEARVLALLRGAGVDPDAPRAHSGRRPGT